MLDNSNTIEVVDGEEVNIHSRVKGDVTKVKKRANSAGWKVMNEDNPLRIEYLKPSRLTPIYTQRDTSASWAEQRLKELGGLDMIAFAALSVGYDASTDTYWLFDGCGRDLLASIVDSDMEVPCLVWDLDQKQAAFYFSYNQDRGRRKLPGESIFVNSWFHGDKDSVWWGEILRQLNLKISANPDYNAPYGPSYDTPKDACEISSKGIKAAFNIAGGRNVSHAQKFLIVEQAKNIIFSAFAKQDEYEDVVLDRINPELLCAVSYILRVYSDKSQLVSENLRRLLVEYLKTFAQVQTQNTFIKDLKFKYSIPGMSKADQLAMCNSWALVNEIRSSSIFKHHPNVKVLSNNIKANEIKPPIPLRKP